MKPEQFENSALVETWLKEPTWLEPVDTARVADLVQRTPQARRWSPGIRTWRLRSVFNAAGFVTASIALALVGGFLVTSLPTEPATDPAPAAVTSSAPSTTATIEPEPTEPTEADVTERLITLPAELPEGVGSGTLETPAGPARWVRLDASDGSVPPYAEQILPWGDGLANWEDYLGLLQATTDGVDWELVETPFAHGAMALIDGAYVVVDPSEDRVWTTTDPQAGWRELDATALADSRQSGWRTFDRRVGTGPLVVDGRIVFTLQNQYQTPREALGISRSGTKKMKRLSDTRYALCSGGKCPNGGVNAKWLLRFKETPRGLAVFLDKTGERLGLIERATADELYEGEYGQHHAAFAIEGDTVVAIDSPWPGLRPAQASNRTVAPGGTVPVVKRWRSDGTDGDSVPDLPSIAAEVPEGGTLVVTRHPEGLAAAAYGQGWKPLTEAWASTDGSEWTAAPEGVPKGASPSWTGSAWFARRGQPGDSEAEHWLHLGGAWISLGSLELPPVVYQPASSDGVTLISGHGGSDDTIGLWVLTHPLGSETE